MKEKDNLLIYAHYYIPDTASTGQIIGDLADGLKDKFNITVICVVPSYLGVIDEKYKNKKFYKENINGVNVLRIRVTEFNKENKKSRVRNILDYFFGAIIATFKVGKQKYVFSISQPPILGGLLGVWGKWVKKAKLIYNIQDFNPEQIKAVSYSQNKSIISMMMILDKFTCKKSDLVITVGSDLVDTLKCRFKKKEVPKYALINNWINEKEIYPLEKDAENVLSFKKKYGIDNKIVIMYSGNLGLYYDLENLLKVIKKFKPGTKNKNGKEVAFVFIGAGSVMKKMIDYKEKNHMDNVIFIPYQEKNNLINSLNSGDIHWCVNGNGIKGVSCPSKVYGIMAVAKPIIGVLEKGTEVRKLIENSKCGKCCDPGQYDEIERLIRWFLENDYRDMGLNGRKYLEQNLSKDISIKKYYDEIRKI